MYILKYSDEIARKRRVFKVETVGDCYVAVTGLPDPRKDHAVAMARFARDILMKMRSLSKKLEVTLGPDTVSMLCGIIKLNYSCRPSLITYFGSPTGRLGHANRNAQWPSHGWCSSG